MKIHKTPLQKNSKIYFEESHLLKRYLFISQETNYDQIVTGDKRISFCTNYEVLGHFV